MTLNRLLITAVVVEKRPVREVSFQYGVSKSWLFVLLQRHRTEGDAVVEPPVPTPRVFADRKSRPK